MSAVFDSSSPMQGSLRRAALTLHAATAADREWLLARLPAGDRPLLEQLLAELASLGLPRDAGMVRAALREPEAVGLAATSRPPAGLQALHAADITCLADQLRQEPISLVAQVVAMLPASRRSALLDALDETQRNQVGAALTACAAAPPARLSEAILAALAPRLQPAVPAPLWARLAVRCAAALRHLGSRS